MSNIHIMQQYFNILSAILVGSLEKKDIRYGKPIKSNERIALCLNIPCNSKCFKINGHDWEREKTTAFNCLD